MINFKGIYGIGRGPVAPVGARKASPAGREPLQSAQTTAPRDADRVQISPDATFRAALAAAQREGAAAAEQPVSAARIEALRAAYAGGACPATGAQIADAMLARSRGLSL